jgi:hypothetical protein
MLLGLTNQPLDVLLGKPATGLDLDLLLLAARLVLCRSIDDAVGVDVESDLDLRHTTRGRWDADEIELAQELVIRCHLALPLEDTHGNGWLIVLRGREDLALLGRDRGFAVDQPREHAPSVSMPKDSGVTSSSSTSLTSPVSTAA